MPRACAWIGSLDIIALVEAGMPSHSSGSEFVQGDRGEKAPAADLLSVDDLARCCAEETNKFLRNITSNDRYCLDLYLSAICSSCPYLGKSASKRGLPAWPGWRRSSGERRFCQIRSGINSGQDEELRFTGRSIKIFEDVCA